MSRRGSLPTRREPVASSSCSRVAGPWAIWRGSGRTGCQGLEAGWGGGCGASTVTGGDAHSHTPHGARALLAGEAPPFPDVLPPAPPGFLDPHSLLGQLLVLRKVPFRDRAWSLRVGASEWPEQAVLSGPLDPHLQRGSGGWPAG